MKPLKVADLPTERPATVAFRTGAKDGNTWEYVHLSESGLWSDGSDLGINGSPADIVYWINRSKPHELRVWAGS